MINKLKSFFNKYNVVIIVNTSTDVGLLCLNPDFQEEDNHLVMKFNSLSQEKMFNYVEVCKIHEESQDNIIYFENLEGNILMLQELTLANYNYYIKNNYFNIPNSSDINQIKEYIINQY